MKQLLLLIRRQVKPRYIIATYSSVLSLFSKLFSQVLYRNIFLCEEFFFSNLPCETSMVELFEKMFDDFLPLTIFAKSSIIVWRGPKHASADKFLKHLRGKNSGICGQLLVAVDDWISISPKM